MRTSNFYSKISKTDTCWLWTAAKNRKGYGQIRVNGVLWIAHRYSYYIHTGVHPDNNIVMHMCDVPSCVNPNHLKLGTYLENNHDRDQKGRFCRLKREKNGNSKLTQSQVAEILQLYSTGKYSYRDLGEMFNVHYSLIGILRKGTSDV